MFDDDKFLTQQALIYGWQKLPQLAIVDPNRYGHEASVHVITLSTVLIPATDYAYKQNGKQAYRERLQAASIQMTEATIDRPCCTQLGNVWAVAHAIASR